MQKIAIKYGMRMFASLVVLFVIVHLLGLSQNYHLRLLNGFIHLAFLYLAIKAYRMNNPDITGNYISGVAIGIYMTMIAVILFGFCMMLYLTWDQAFFGSLKDQFPYPELFTPFTASLGILVEGVAMGVIGSYIVTRVIDTLLTEGKTRNPV